MAENPFEPPAVESGEATPFAWGRISLTLSSTAFACVCFAAHLGPGATLCIPAILAGFMERSPRTRAARTGIGLGLLTLLYVPTMFLPLTL